MKSSIILRRSTSSMSAGSGSDSSVKKDTSKGKFVFLATHMQHCKSSD